MAITDIISIPKTELHMHLDGSIPIDLTWELMKRYDLSPCETLDEIETLLTMQPEDEASLLNYLDKFHYPLWITQFYENIQLVTRKILEGLARHSVTVVEIRYSPIVHTYAGLTVRQAIGAVLSGMNWAVETYEIQAGLVVIAMRQHGPHIAKILARQAIAEDNSFMNDAAWWDLISPVPNEVIPLYCSVKPSSLHGKGVLVLRFMPERTKAPVSSGKQLMIWELSESDTVVPPSRIRNS